MTNPTPSDYSDAAAGAAVYSRPALLVYDLFVLGFSNTFAWQCPSREILGFYNRYVSGNHLDVGVGTGYFLDKCRFPEERPRVALVDLNPNSLAVTARRLRRYRPVTHLANVLEPLALVGKGFDSVGLNYLLHCLPGEMAEKGVVFDHLRPWLKEGGVVFGTTLLGQGVRPNFLARRLMGLYNGKGIFSNRQDSAGALEAALRARFREVTVELKGCAAFFVGRK